MRVLQLIDSLNAGGAERMAVHLANGLTSKISKSYLCATRAEGDLKDTVDDTVGYLYLKRNGILDVKALWRLYTFVKQEDISVVHAHASSFFLATLLKWVIPKIDLIWHDHYGQSEFLSQRPKHAIFWCSYFFKATITVNEALARWHRVHLNCKCVTYIPNFVANSNYKRKTHLKGEVGKRILCLANLRPQKDHFNLLEAFGLIAQKYPDWTLHCVGRDFNDDYSKQLFETIKVLGLETQVFLYGSCPDTEWIISQSDIGVLASKSEGLPLSLLEYGLGGLAVIATDVGDNKRVIQSRASGCLVASAHVETLAEALMFFMNNEKQRKSCGKHLQNHIKSEFDADAILDRIFKVYLSINKSYAIH
ncbi:glycosyltransferase [Formosa sp. S-31]|uniref:glycosyltransferase n=1 Tax=Formosa sp. S-31 TaxID=2790949 RepID=UPI003EB8095A